MQVEERSLDSLNKQQKEQQEQLEKYDKEISSKEAELKKLINEKPKSWLERKLESFQAAIERFEVKYKLTKDNKSKGIIKKILSVLTRIVKWINGLMKNYYKVQDGLAINSLNVKKNLKPMKRKFLSWI